MRWRADNDKMGWEHVTPLSVTAVQALRRVLARGVVIGDSPIFPNEDDPLRSCSRHCFSDWWRRLVVLAKLPASKRRGWHSLRRKWATETKGAMPLKDQAHAGGWKSTATLLELYQRADWDSMVEGLTRRGTLKQVAR